MAAYFIFKELGQKHELASQLSPNDIGTLVAAACLSHDIGNPPFGHSGEDSISYYFKRNPENFMNLWIVPGFYGNTKPNLQYKFTTESGEVKEILVSREEASALEKRWQDLSRFEGNANGFRIITNNCDKGINPTAALLGTFTKYPRDSALLSWQHGNEYPKTLSKYGFFQTELSIFEQLVEELGLLKVEGLAGCDLAYCRHPLAFLMEASDDIAYSIIDFEDGCRLGLIDFTKEYKTLQLKTKEGKQKSEPINTSPLEIFTSIARMDDSFDPEKPLGEMDFKEALSYLRSKVINVLTHECFRIFSENYEGIMTGTFTKSLIDEISDDRIKSGMKKMKALVRKFVYNFPPVLQSEASGFEVMYNLIESLAITSNVCINCGEVPDERGNKLKSLLPEEYSPREENEKDSLSKEEIYHRAMSVLDYVSGMTDNYAMSLYRKIKGISHH
jgi:dGTPase